MGLTSDIPTASKRCAFSLSRKRRAPARLTKTAPKWIQVGATTRQSIHPGADSPRATNASAKGKNVVQIRPNKEPPEIAKRLEMSVPTPAQSPSPRQPEAADSKLPGSGNARHSEQSWSSSLPFLPSAQRMPGSRSLLIQASFGMMVVSTTSTNELFQRTGRSE